MAIDPDTTFMESLFMEIRKMELNNVRMGKYDDQEMAKQITSRIRKRLKEHMEDNA